MEYSYFDYRKVLAILNEFSKKMEDLKKRDCFKDDDFTFTVDHYEDGHSILFSLDLSSREFTLIDVQLYFNGLMFIFKMEENHCTVHVEADFSVEEDNYEEFFKEIFPSLFTEKYGKDENIDEEDWRKALDYFMKKVHEVAYYKIKHSQN